MTERPESRGVHSADFSAGGRHATSPNGGRLDANDRSGRALMLAGVARDARLDGKFLLLIGLSAAIATLGLLQNSTAVVIGAMLVSPLLGPIMGVGFGLATIDWKLIRRSLLTLLAGVAVAVVIAMLLVWLSPIKDVTTELRARTQPTLLDLGVAVVGGIAGVYAILRKLSGVMVGVAIATALVPPLSTVGFGLATGRFDFAAGASLLFLTNTLAIAFAGTAVARFNRFGPSLTAQATMMQLAGIVATLGILSIPLALSLNNIAREFAAQAAVRSALTAMMAPDDKIDSLSVQFDGDRMTVDGVLLVSRYNANLNSRLATIAARRLDRPVTVSLSQLRQQNGTAEQIEDRVNQRLTALEQHDAESESMLRDLTVGNLIPRDSISIDAQARRAIVARNRAEEDPAVRDAVDRVMTAAQTNHPDWLVRTGVLTAPAATATAPAR